MMLEVRLMRSEEHTSELQTPCNLVCRLLLEKKKIISSPEHTNFRATRHGPRPRARPWISALLRCFFFFNDAAPPEISPLPLPAALPISAHSSRLTGGPARRWKCASWGPP